EVDSTVRRATVVLHLEGKARVAGTVRVGGRREAQEAGGDISRRYRLSGGDRGAVVRQGPRRGQRADFHCEKSVAIGVAEPEVRRGEDVRGVLERSHDVFRPGRSVADRGAPFPYPTLFRSEVDSAVRRATVVLNLEGKARVAGAVGVGRG